MNDDSSNQNVKNVNKETKEPVFPDDYLHFDSEMALKKIMSLPEQIRDGYNLGEGVVPKSVFSKILIIGMGGSGIAGWLLKSYLESIKDFSIPVFLQSSYAIPSFVDDNTLVFAISYSGNTEETLSMYKLACRKKVYAVTVSSGGKLMDLAKLNNHAHIKIPEGYQPRMALGYLFFPLLRVLENSGVLSSNASSIKALVEHIRRQPYKLTSINLSKKLFNKIPLIWSDSHFYPVAYRFKTQINENAKATAFSHEFSELNHNEILSFTNRLASFQVVILSTESDHRRVSKRIDLTKKILQKKGVPVTEIAVKGSTLQQMFSAILLGDLTSYFLALHYEVNPTPVDLIEEFKKDLGPFLI